MTINEIKEVVDRLIREGKLYPPGTLLGLLNSRTRKIELNEIWNKVSLITRYVIEHPLMREAVDDEQVYDWILCEKYNGISITMARGEYLRYAYGPISHVGPEHGIEERQFGETVLS